MLHRAFCLLPTSPVAAVATTPAYAAGRAWARHTRTTVSVVVGTRYRKLTRTASKSTYKQNIAVATAPAKSSSNLALTSNDVEDLNRLSDWKVAGFRRTPHLAGNPSCPTDDQLYKDCTLNVTYFDPDSFADWDFDSIPGVSSQPREITPAHIPRTRPPRPGQPSSIITNAVSVSPAGPSFRLSRPTTRYALRKNLIYLVSICRPTPSLPVLVDYHALYPDLQTTWSYNLLIALALRHVSFGVTQMLFTEMRRSKIKGNFETWKLQVRSLIQAGFWDRAWRQVMETTNSPIPGNSRPRHEMPLPIWLEFCRSLRKGILRKPPKARWIVNEQREVVRNAAAETVTEGPDTLLLYRARQRLLFRHRPTHMPDLATTHPNTIYHIVYLLLQSQQGDRALLLTTSYLRALPRKLRKKTAMRCLDIIHLHITFNRTTKGLRKLYETQQTLNTLLKLHRSLRPTSSTLFLLLSTLRHAKRCGTVANNVVRAFKLEWGPQVEDGRVRRRLVTLALKEGRRDLVKHIGKLETEACRATRSWTFEREVLGGTQRWPFKRVFRYPGRKLFVKNGKERRLWHRVQKRAWLKMGVKIK